jgi:2-oxoglutarate ferredoxin oxidoreductase subunit beta
VSFNDHEGSTKSYKFTREHEVELTSVDFVPLRKEIAAEQGVAGGLTSVTMHDGSIVRFRKTDDAYDATDRNAAYSHVKTCIDKGEIATGLLFLDENAAPDMHGLNKTVAGPLVDVPYAELCPGSKALDELMAEYR